LALGLKDEVQKHEFSLSLLGCPIVLKREKGPSCRGQNIFLEEDKSRSEPVVQEITHDS